MIDLRSWIEPVLKNADQRWEVLVRDFPRLRTKLYSELISNIIEESFRVTVPGVRVGVADGEPDLYIWDHPVEIKTAANNRVWRGGDFSKRPGEYLLVGYTQTDKRTLKWFVVQTELTKSEWISSGSDNYYATSVNLDSVLNGGKFQVLWGDTIFKKTVTHPVYRAVDP